MEKPKQPSDDSLRTLTVIGRVMVTVPLLAVLAWYLYGFLSPAPEVEPAVEGPTIAILHYNPLADTLGSGAFLIFVCGLAILVYTAVKKFRQGLKGQGQA